MPSQSEGATPVHIPDLPPEFMQAIVHQISQQTGHPGRPGAGVPGTTSSSEPSAPHPDSPLPPGARVAVTRPSFSPHIPQPVVTNINLRASVPPAGGQHNLQVRQGDADMEKSVEGLWSGCAALLLRAHSTDLFFQGTPLAHSPVTQMISGLVGQLQMPGHQGE